MDPFQTIGVVCLVAAIIGGGLKAAGFEIGSVRSLGRQVVLGCFGVSLFAYGTPEVRGLVLSPGAPPSTAPQMVVAATQTAPPTVVPTAAAAPQLSATVPASPPLPTELSGPAATVEAATPLATLPPNPTVGTASAPASVPAAAPAQERKPRLPAIRPDGPLRR